MSGNTFGKNFKIMTWGESHGKALGVVIDGCPAGLPLSENDIQKNMDRRKPGKSEFDTKRKEADRIEILSGVFEGITTGTPISLILYNTDQRSKDYSGIKDILRPGHADYTFHEKYKIRDYRGGGRASGRETTGRVAAGAVAEKILAELGIKILGYTIRIAGIDIDRNNFDESEINNSPLYLPDAEAYKKISEKLKEIIKDEDSAGGVAEIKIAGLKAGIGEPVFDKLNANLAKALFSIGGVKAVEIGEGFKSSDMKGSEMNDGLYWDSDIKIQKFTNNSGGITGGISDSGEIITRIYFKPTPSIHKTQKTASLDEKNLDINIKGRHDPLIVARGLVVAEAMAALTVVDLVLENMSSRFDNIKKLYT